MDSFVLVDPKSRNLYSSIQFWRLHLPCQYWSEVPSRGKNHSCIPDVLCLLFLFCISYKEPPQPRGPSPPLKYSSHGLASVFQRPARTVFQIHPLPRPRYCFHKGDFYWDNSLFVSRHAVWWDYHLSCRRSVFSLQHRPYVCGWQRQRKHQLF